MIGYWRKNWDRHARHNLQKKIVFNLLIRVNSLQCSTSVIPRLNTLNLTTKQQFWLTPILILGASNSVDTVLVTAGCSLSDHLLKIGQFCYKLRLNQDNDINLQIHSVSALKTLLYSLLHFCTWISSEDAGSDSEAPSPTMYLSLSWGMKEQQVLPRSLSPHEEIIIARKNALVISPSSNGFNS